MRLEAVSDDAAEELAADAERRAAAQHRAGAFPFEGRGIHLTLARHHERRARSALVEPRDVEHELGALDQLATHRGECGSEAAAGARARSIAVRRELVQLREAALELLDVIGRRALLWTEDARGAAYAEQWVAHVAGDAQRHIAHPAADHPAHADAAVDGGGAAEADEDRRRACG